MHAQNRAFPWTDPESEDGRRVSELELARVYRSTRHDQEKTRGNLSNEESTVLRNALSICKWST